MEKRIEELEQKIENLEKNNKEMVKIIRQHTIFNVKVTSILEKITGIKG